MTGAGLAAGAVATTVAAGTLGLTPDNPEGPFYPIHQQTDMDADLTRIAGHEERATGEVICVSGQVLDESGVPIEGALVDIWQANANGRYLHEGDTSDAPLDPNFQYWAQMKTDAEGRYRYTTIKPAAYAAMGEWVRPPHIHYKVSRRGYRELTTQMYFAGEALNEKDLLLLEVPEDLRGRLTVAFDRTGEVPEGVFDVVLEQVRPA
jgi:protocatechuate 3,4-dioxygenase beta subunit